MIGFDARELTSASRNLRSTLRRKGRLKKRSNRNRGVVMRVQTMLIAMAISFGTARAAQAVTVQKATFARTQLAFFASLQADVACGGDAGTQTAFVTVFISGG